MRTITLVAGGWLSALVVVTASAFVWADHQSEAAMTRQYPRPPLQIADAVYAATPPFHHVIVAAADGDQSPDRPPR